MSELKNCPFCGGKEVVQTGTIYSKAIYCDECGAEACSAINWNRRADGWIKCSERLPDTVEQILFMGQRRERYVGWYDKTSCVFYDKDNNYNNISYWQPLPAQPVEE